VELQEKQAEYLKQGLNVAALSYDSPAVLKGFAERKGITYPLLSDPESTAIRAFGILNETMPKGAFYGVPWPATFVVGAEGKVKARFFEEDYKQRYTAGNVLLRVAPSAAGDGWTETSTKHLKIRNGASDTKARGGSRVTLVVDVDLPARMHVYAPGVKEYIPVDWQMASNSAVAKIEAAIYPAARTMHLAAIKETVPVFEGKVRIVRDVVLAQQKELMEAAGSAGQLVLEGGFRYQACDDKVCYPPVTVPLKWTLSAEEHDRMRAPEEVRRK
jgi:hypothetical protein